MNQSIQVNKYIQINETDEAPQGDNAIMASTGASTFITNLTTNNTTRLPIQSDKGLSNEVTASSHHGTWMRHPTKHAVKAEAPHHGIKRLRQVWMQAGNEILECFICYFDVYLMQNREFYMCYQMFSFIPNKAFWFFHVMLLRYLKWYL